MHMEFERLTTEAKKLKTVFAAETGIAHEKIRMVASPYRICPLGAHIDHQGGPVLGMTINAYTIQWGWFRWVRGRFRESTQGRRGGP